MEQEENHTIGITVGTLGTWDQLNALECNPGQLREGGREGVTNRGIGVPALYIP